VKWILYTVVTIAVLTGATVLVGYALPAKTTIARSITLPQPPATARHSAMCRTSPSAAKTAANRNTEKVEMLPPVDGKEATKQTFKGGMTMTIITAESAPPHHLVREMGDNGGPFAGS